MQSSKAITESSQSVCPGFRLRYYNANKGDWSDCEARSQSMEDSYTPESFEERRGVCNRNVEMLNSKFL